MVSHSGWFGRLLMFGYTGWRCSMSNGRPAIHWDSEIRCLWCQLLTCFRYCTKQRCLKSCAYGTKKLSDVWVLMYGSFFLLLFIVTVISNVTYDELVWMKFETLISLNAVVHNRLRISYYCPENYYIGSKYVIIIFINCHRVVTRWQWLLYM